MMDPIVLAHRYAEVYRRYEARWPAYLAGNILAYDIRVLSAELESIESAARNSLSAADFTRFRDTVHSVSGIHSI